MKSDFLIALTQLAAERHLPREQVLQAIEAALASALKKDSPTMGQNISVKLDPNSAGEPISVFATKTVVETVEDSETEIEIAEARNIREDAALGDEVPVETLELEFSRIAAQTAKQVVLQRLREVERDLVYQEFVERTGDVISGVVGQIEAGRVVILELGRAQAALFPEEQVITERYRKGQRLKVYVDDVRRTSKGPEILVSRSHKNLLKRLFEIEVPEVFNGIVEIKSIAREPGSRSKVAVTSRQEGIDPVGSCIGMRGNRIQSIVNELQGEKIDVVRWDANPKVFLANALSPSEVVHVELEEETGNALAVVPERQLSLAIGREGQNARLAAKLTNFRLDIKSMSEWELIRSQRQAPEDKKAEAEEAAVAVEEPEVEAAVLEAEAVVAEAQAVEAATAEAEPVAEADAETVEAVEAPVAETTEAADAEEGVAVPSNKLTPEEELALLALEEAEAATATEPDEDEEDEDGEEEGEEFDDTVFTVAVPAAGPGTIRFAEDIMEDFRGPGRRGRRRRGSGAAAAARARRRPPAKKTGAPRPPVAGAGT